MAQLINQKYYEGAVNDGEKRLFGFLEAKLPDDYYIIPNVHITYKNPRNGAVETLEYDCIVVAPHAIYNIENKDWRGRLEGNDYEWFLNGKARPNPLRSCSFKTKVLVSKLKEEDSLFGRAWISSIVTLSHSTMMDFELTGECARVTFTVDKSLTVFLQEPGSAKSYENKIQDIQKRIVEFISGKSKAAKTPVKKIFEDQYTIERILSQEENYTDYLVKAKIEESQFVKRIREYSIDFVGLSKEEQKKKIDKIKNQYYALEKIGLNPYILPVQSLTDDINGYYYEVSDYLEETSLLASMISKTFSFQEKINIILNVANALRVAHQATVFHRDVCPANIFLAGGFAYLGNFGKAIFISSNRGSYTVMPTLKDENMSPYMAVELKNKEADKRTDIYSLGVTIYQLLTNRLPFNSWSDLDKMGGKLSDELLPSKIDSALPAWVDDLLIKLICLNPEDRLQSVEEVIAAIQNSLQQTTSENKNLSSDKTTSTKADESEIKPGHKEGAYLFIEEIKDGGFSHVWKVKHTLQGQEMAMKIFNESVHVDNVIQEYQALKEISHPNIVKFLWNDRLSDGRFYTVMELLLGRDLNEYYKGAQRLRMDFIYKLGKELCEALTFLHSKGIRHRDIKPQNIIWDKNERFVLIDFNVATKEDGDKGHVGTDTYIPPDKWVNTRKIDWDDSCDTFALGITLYQLVCKKHPWKNNQPLTSVPPTHPKEYNQDISDEFADFLFKSIQPNSQQRFTSAADMMVALSKIGALGLTKSKSTPPVASKLTTENFVLELNRLYSQSKHNNSGTRGLDEFAEQTYIETKLDTALQKAILDGTYKLIIITGNAGDGKTAFIQKLENALSKFSGSNFKKLPSKNGASFIIDGVTYMSNYDGSQDEKNKDNNQVLDEFFKPFENIRDFDKAKEGRIIAINEGRLVEYLLSKKESHSHLEKIVDDYFYNEGTTDLPSGILIINLNLRSVVGATDAEEASILRKQIKEFVKPENWQGCQGCVIKEKCFIRMNAQTLNDSDSGDEVITRMEVLLKTLHLRRELHITMRDIRSLIAFWITRDFSCEEAKQLAENADKPIDILELFYFNITDSEAIDSGNNDRLVRLIRNIDVGLTALPTLDRELFFSPVQDKNYLLFGKREVGLISWLNRVKEIYSSKPEEERISDVKTLHKLLARFQYFEGQFNYLQRIPYRSVSKFKDYVIGPTEENKQHIKQNLSKAIAILENCRNEILGANNIILSVGKKDPFCYSFRLFPLDDFELIEDKKPKLEKFIEYFPDKLIFRHKKENKISLSISLDLYEMLFFIGKGFSPSLNDLKGRFIELQVFMNMLSNLPYREVVVTEDNKEYFSIKATDENKIVIEKSELGCQ